MKERRKTLSIDDLVTIMLNKMLEKYGVDVQYILEHQYIDGKLWCTYYTFTKEEAEEYKIWAMKFLKENRKNWNKAKIEKEFSWFNLMWGLRVDESINKENG